MQYFFGGAANENYARFNGSKKDCTPAWWRWRTAKSWEAFCAVMTVEEDVFTTCVWRNSTGNGASER